MLGIHENTFAFPLEDGEDRAGVRADSGREARLSLPDLGREEAREEVGRASESSAGIHDAFAQPVQSESRDLIV